jgi:hypothetical protein
LFKVKKGDNFIHPGTICRPCPGIFTGTYGAGRNTLSISRINPPKFGGGLKFEPVDKSRSAGTQKLSGKGRYAKVSPVYPGEERRIWIRIF